MASDDAPPQSIRSIFEAAETKRRAIEASFDTTSPSFTTTLDAAIALYTRALDSIATASVFSPNEGIEDVSTTDVPLLLVTFHIAELVQRKPTRDPADRNAVIDRARTGYTQFLDAADAYGLVTGPYAKLLERYRDDGAKFAAAGSGDAASRRSAKIASFQAEKELRGKLEALRRNPRYVDDGDEELVRGVYLAEVAFAVHRTFHALDSMNREAELLASAPPPLPPATTTPHNDPLSRPRETDHDPTLRLDRPFQGNLGAGGPLLSREGRPLQPFTLLGSSDPSSRQELRRGVFRPGHNLPTMSIDEYLDEERRRGNIIEGGGEQPKPALDEDDMDAVDREMYKAREWDEFKDHNPKGSGNTLNMG